MFDQNDSIFTVVPEEQQVIRKEKLYKSKHDPKIAPTSSTFVPGQRQLPISNNGGTQDYKLVKSGKIATMGKPAQQNAAKPDQFLPKNTLEKTQKLIEETKKAKWEKTVTKDKLVSKEDKPIMNLHSNKDFIRTNKKETILYTKKPEVIDDAPKNYGVVPKYLSKVKSEIENEQNLLNDLKREMDEERRNSNLTRISEERRTELIAQLEAQLAQINVFLNAQAIHIKMDSHLIRKKEEKEEKARDIEKQLKVLKKGEIYVSEI